jgi:hypothetical protein
MIIIPIVGKQEISLRVLLEMASQRPTSITIVVFVQRKLLVTLQQHTA